MLFYCMPNALSAIFFFVHCNASFAHKIDIMCIIGTMNALMKMVICACQYDNQQWTHEKHIWKAVPYMVLMAAETKACFAMCGAYPDAVKLRWWMGN